MQTLTEYRAFSNLLSKTLLVQVQSVDLTKVQEELAYKTQKKNFQEVYRNSLKIFVTNQYLM